MKLLLDEMYAPAVAEQLRARGHDAVSIHDREMRWLEGAPDEEVWLQAIETRRTLVTENVQDFVPIEAAALARGEPMAPLILTTDRRFPRGDPRTVGCLGLALDARLRAPSQAPRTQFLGPAAGEP